MKSYEGGEKKYKILVIITDGEDHVGDTERAAKEAEKEGVKIFCIGIGTKEGELIPLTDSLGKRGYLKDADGNYVKSRLGEDSLKKVAATTGGSYVHATGVQFGLDIIYEQYLSKMEKKELEGKMMKRYEERFQLPLILALLALMAGPFINERKKTS